MSNGMEDQMKKLLILLGMALLMGCHTEEVTCPCEQRAEILFEEIYRPRMLECENLAVIALIRMCQMPIFIEYSDHRKKILEECEH